MFILMSTLLCSSRNICLQILTWLYVVYYNVKLNVKECCRYLGVHMSHMLLIYMLLISSQLFICWTSYMYMSDTSVVIQVSQSKCYINIKFTDQLSTKINFENAPVWELNTWYSSLISMRWRTSCMESGIVLSNRTIFKLQQVANWNSCIHNNEP